MKKIFSLLMTLCLIAINSVSVMADETDTHKAIAKNELNEIFRLYDEFDYKDENWQIMLNTYNNGFSAIDAANTSDEAYAILNDTAESMISVPHKYRSVIVGISVENLVTQKGYIIFPELIKVPKYQSVAQTLTEMLESKFEVRDVHHANGTVENNFELISVYQGISTSIDDPIEIDTPNYLRSYVGNSLSEPSDKTYLKSGDYTDESCFVYSVNNKFYNVKASAIPVVEEDIIRWQFSIYGKGADVGANTYYSEAPLINSSDKTELYTYLAEIVQKNDMSLLLTDELNKKYFNDALVVAEIINISQKAVDKAIDKLEKIKPVTAPPADSEPQHDITPPEDEIKPVPPIVFKDLEENHFAKEAIDYLSVNGIISGRPDGYFGVDDPITRAEFAVILARYDEYSETAKLPFTDVKTDDWFASGIAYCYKNGITNGITPTTFNPHAPITRQELATMLYRFTQHKDIKLDTFESQEFTDATDISDYAKEAVNSLKSAGLINGRDNNKFYPFDNATRAECAKMFYNLIK